MGFNDPTTEALPRPAGATSTPRYAQSRPTCEREDVARASLAATLMKVDRGVRGSDVGTRAGAQRPGEFISRRYRLGD